MTSIGTIAQIWRYPAKSMGGERLPSSEITVQDGVVGDRRWTVRDEELREIVNGRRIPSILLLEARFTGRAHSTGEPQLEIALPSGETVLSDDPYVHAILSVFLGRRVSLQHLRPKSETGHYKYGHFVTPKDLRRILGRPPHGPMPDPSRLRFPNLLEILRFSVQRGTYFDLSRLHIVTTASLRRFQEMLPESNLDVRRFRPNLVIETAANVEPFAENDWSGWSLRIGEVNISIHSPAIRCTMPGQAQSGLPADQQVQLILRQSLNEDFGVYADPLSPGMVRVGDAVTLIPPANRIGNRMLRALNTAAIKALGAPNILVDKIEQAQARAAPKAHKPLKPTRDYRAMTVVEKTNEGEDAVSIVLQPDAPLPWPDFLPGQNLMVRLEIPGQPRAVYRSFSISNSPTEIGRYRITIKRELASAPDVPPGLASSYLIDALKTGDRIHARGPMGPFHLRPGDSRPLVFLSCGIGVTPLASMAHAIARANPARELRWFHGVRNEAQFALGSELRVLAGKLPNLKLTVRQSRPSAPISGGAGRLDFDFVRSQLPHLDFDFYLCGTPGFMEGFHRALRAAGVLTERIHAEFFSQGRSLEDMAQGARPEGRVRAKVTFARSGRDLIWESGAPSLLDFAERNGIAIEFGCRYGNCHACKVRLLSGEVRKSPLADPPPEADAILLCSATPAGDIVLDA